MSQLKQTEQIAQRVISIEAQALVEMAMNLPTDFSKAVNKILSINGRIIVSGVGKSGHVGSKIAATLASTGTPANFVHATEASHGDLGMITQNDFCLIISNSGETSELHDIVEHSRRYNIPMAAISSRLSSTLMRAADFKLLLPTAPEACSIGMAPTTSTTLTLALGDALAVTLMELRNFKPEDFKVFHPGGKLGKLMSQVQQFMRPVSEMAILSSRSEMREIIFRMTESGYGMAILIDEYGAIDGVITDGDLRRNADSVFEKEPLSIASSNPVTISPKELVSSAINTMERMKVYTILVVDKEKPVGLLRMHDLLRAGLA